MSQHLTSDHYPFSWPVRVYYEDTDTGGVVYYANYLKFYERARTEALRHVGFGQEVLKNEQNLLFVVSGIQADYKRPAVLDDELTVFVRIAKMARTYLIFEQKVVKQVEGKEVLLNLASVKVACVQGDNYRPKALPEALAESLSSLMA